jgi:hypothetical protein
MAERQGVEEVTGWNAVLRHLYLLDVGSPELVIDGLHAALPAMRANGEHVTVDWANCVTALALSELGRFSDATERAAHVLDRARTTQDPELLVMASVAVAEADAGTRMLAHAREVLLELADTVKTTGLAWAPFYPLVLPRLTRVARQADDIALVEAFAASVPGGLPLREKVAITSQALQSEGTDDVNGALRQFTRAAVEWEEFGNTYEQAHALLGVARCHTRRGDTAGKGAVTRARKLFASLGADRWIRACDDLTTRTKG